MHDFKIFHIGWSDRWVFRYFTHNHRCRCPLQFQSMHVSLFMSQLNQIFNWCLRALALLANFLSRCYSALRPDQLQKKSIPEWIHGLWILGAIHSVTRFCSSWHKYKFWLINSVHIIIIMIIYSCNIQQLIALMKYSFYVVIFCRARKVKHSLSCLTTTSLERGIVFFSQFNSLIKNKKIYIENRQYQ